MILYADELRSRFEPVKPMDFYREVFPEGELDDYQSLTKGKYTGIALEIEKAKTNENKPKVKRYNVYDSLDELDFLMNSENFCVIAPISYAGKTRQSENARVMYALCVELDNLVADGGLKRLINQWSDRVDWIPCPTFVVASGTGLHLYYVFEKGIQLYPSVVKCLKKYKRELTKKIWNSHTTTDYTDDKIQQESIFQPFRMVGTLTKRGEKTQAFRTGEPVTIEYMNHFAKNHIQLTYTNQQTLAEAKTKYPEWYDKQVVQHAPKGHWTCKRDLYDWWKRRIIPEGAVHHRYWCLYILCVYAIKCDISKEELEKDCFEIQEIFEAKTDDETNHFTERDVLCALQAYEDRGLFTYPVNSISYRSGLAIEKNKRNGRTQKKHLQGARAIRDINNENWREGNGRPQKKELVAQWQQAHPEGTKAECNRDTKIDPKTIRKWWQ